MRESCPWVLNSSLFLLLLFLYLPLFRAQDYPDDDPYQMYHNPYYPISGRFGNAMDIFRNKDDENVLQYCDGAFDLYYVFDISKTVSNWAGVYAAWEDMVEKYLNSKLRISYILYATEASVKMALTSSREAFRQQLFRVQFNMPKGETFLQEGLKKANEQIQNANAGDTKVSSMIIALVSGPLQPQALEESKEEVRKAREMGAYIYCIGMDSYKLNQLLELADSSEHILEVKQSPLKMHALVDQFGTKTCLELRSVEPSPLCVEGTDPVILNGYGFNNGKTTDQIICRFKFSDTNVIESHPIAMNMTSLTCPKPNVQKSGETIIVEVSLNNGRNYLDRPVVVNTTENCTPPPETAVITEYPTYPPETSARPKTTTRRTTPKPTPPPSRPETTPTTQAVTPSKTFVYIEAEPTLEEKLATLLLSLLLIPVVLWWIWWLCCRKVKPPPPQLTEKLKEEPPPPPAPAPVNVCPTIVICCCACPGVCVSRGVENSVTVRNLDHPFYHQEPLTWPQLREQERGNFALMPNLCTQASCGSTICLQPSQDSLPISYCSQCHPLSARCSRSPSQISQLLPSPAQTTCRTVYSLPPP